VGLIILVIAFYQSSRYLEVKSIFYKSTLLAHNKNLYIHIYINTFPEGTTDEDKKASLKAYLTEKFPSPEDVEFIDAQVQIAEYGLTFDDDAFTYGGRKRRTRKIRKGKATKKQNKKSGKPQKHKINTKKQKR
jgi:hypothetical protein